MAVSAPNSNDSYRLDRMEQDVREVLLEVKALSKSFQDFQIAQPATYVPRREYDDDLKAIRADLAGLQRRYTAILVAGLMTVTGLTVELAVYLLTTHGGP